MGEPLDMLYKVSPMFFLHFCVNLLNSADFCLYRCFSPSRFGKKKDEKKEAKSAQQQQKSDMLSDHELHRMKDERER